MICSSNLLIDLTQRVLAEDLAGLNKMRFSFNTNGKANPLGGFSAPFMMRIDLGGGLFSRGYWRTATNGN